MSIAANNFHSTIPQSFWRLIKLGGLNLSKNHLHGFLASDVGNMKAVNIMDISSNKFAGKIPDSLGSLQYLVSRDVSRNEFQGPIPDMFRNLVALETLDLSSNILSGMIPKSLQSLQNLNYLNVSFNGLQGEIPHKGVFTNLTYESLMGNPKLCGRPELSFPVCPVQATTSKGRKLLVLKITIPIIATVLVIVLLLSAWFIGFRKHVKGNTESNSSWKIGDHRVITYYELLRATESFSETNLLGRGSSGTVYKGTLSDGSVVAIKIFTMQWRGAARNFQAECEVLSNVRHRNLVKIISTCLNMEFIAIVLEFIPNGNLDEWLYSERGYLSLVQRIDIVTDIAMALEYLHHDYTVPIVHCDLKPSNVLLDEDLVAHVADFGIAKVLAQDETLVQTETLGTIGYLAPEYGQDGNVSTSSDVYSLGILLLETFTRKKPTDDMFSGDLTLQKWVSCSLPDALMEVLDADLFNEFCCTRVPGNSLSGSTQSCIEQLLVSITHVALLCLKESPEDRINMRNVVVQLKKIKAELSKLSYKSYKQG